MFVLIHSQTEAEGKNLLIQMDEVVEQILPGIGQFKYIKTKGGKEEEGN